MDDAGKQKFDPIYGPFETMEYSGDIWRKAFLDSHVFADGREIRASIDDDIRVSKAAENGRIADLEIRLAAPIAQFILYREGADARRERVSRLMKKWLSIPSAEVRSFWLFHLDFSYFDMFAPPDLSVLKFEKIYDASRPKKNPFANPAIVWHYDAPVEITQEPDDIFVIKTKCVICE